MASDTSSETSCEMQQTRPEPREIELLCAGLSVRGLAWGPVDGRPLLALHGWLDNASSFAPMAAFLPDTWQLVALDLPGHGRSDHMGPGPFPYHFIDYVAAVCSALQALGWEKCALMGHSMGGGIASLVAACVPTKIERLVLLDGLAPLTEAEAHAPARFAHFLADLGKARTRIPFYESVEQAAQARARGSQVSLAAARLLAARGTRETRQVTEKPEGQEGAELGQLGVTWSSDSRLRLTNPLRLTTGHVEAFLRGITCPVWALRCLDSEFQINEDFLKQLLACLSDVTLEVRAGGHHLHMDDPKSIASLVAKFLG